MNIPLLKWLLSSKTFLRVHFSRSFFSYSAVHMSSLWFSENDPETDIRAPVIEDLANMYKKVVGFWYLCSTRKTFSHTWNCTVDEEDSLLFVYKEYVLY